MKKNKTNRFFSFELFKEGLRRTRIVTLAYACFAAILVVYMWVVGSDYEGTTRYGIVSILGMLGIVPLSVMQLFGFLGSRAGSDFHHSLPFKRSCVAISFTLSALASALSVIFGTWLLCLLPNLYRTGYNFAMLGCTAVSCILTAGATLLAVTVTKGWLSQIICTGMLLFMPRVVITCLTEVISGSAYVLYDTEKFAGGFFRSNLNLVWGLLFDSWAFEGHAVEGLLGSAIYTFVLGLGFFAAGVAVYVKRKSEKANDPAINRVVQTALRVLIAFAFCLAPCVELYSAIRRHELIEEDYFLLYALALLSYFLFEAISSKGLRSIKEHKWDMLAGLGVVLLLNAMFFIIPHFYVQKALSFEPKSEDVASVTFINFDEYQTYSEVLRSTIEVSDEETIATVCEDYCSSAKFIKENGRRNEYYYRFAVRFNMKNGETEERYLYSGISSFTEITKLMEENPELKNALVALPSVDEVDFFGQQLFSWENDKAEYVYSTMRDIYATFLEEYEQLSYEQKLFLVNDDMSNYVLSADGMDEDLIGHIGEAITTIGLHGTYDGREYNSNISLTMLTPKALQKMLDFNNSMVPNAADIIDNLDQSSYASMNIELLNYYTENGESLYPRNIILEINGVPNYDEQESTVGVLYYEYWTDDDRIAAEDLKDMIVEALVEGSKQPLDVNKPYYRVSFYSYMMLKDGGYYQYEDNVEVYVPATESDFLDYVLAEYRYSLMNEKE